MHLNWSISFRGIEGVPAFLNTPLVYYVGSIVQCKNVFDYINKTYKMTCVYSEVEE